MGDFIVVAVIVIAVAFGIYSSVKHFKGEGGCCGGGSYKPKRKKLSHVYDQKIFKLEGMHCSHCKNRVEEAVNDIHGVAGRACLKSGELVVSYERDVADDEIVARITRAGYTVIEIKKSKATAP